MTGFPLVVAHRLADVALEPWAMHDELVLDGAPNLRGCILPITSDGREATGAWEAAPSRLYGVPSHDWVKFLVAGRMTVIPDGGEAYDLGPGDALVLRRGCAVEEQIHEPVRLVFQRTSVGPVPGDRAAAPEHRGAGAEATAAPPPTPPARVVDVEAALARAAAGPAAAARRGRGLARGEGRRALLEATVRLIARYGTDGVTYRAVAAEAGVRNGLVNYYFRSRDELVHHALTLALDRARADVRRAHERTGPGERAGLLELIGNGTAMTALRMRLVLHGRLHAELQREIEELYEAYLDVAQRALASSGIPADRALARVVLAALDGLAVQQLVDGPGADLDAAVARLEALLAGLLPSGGA